MVSLNNLHLAFGDRVLFDSVSLFISPRDKIGLVGKNGAGKSTLLKVLTGEVKSNGGNVSRSSEITIGYLAQELEIDQSKTVRLACKEVFSDLVTMERRKEEIEKLITDEKNIGDNRYGEWLDELSSINDELTHHAGNKVDKQIENILYGLGFEREEFDNRLDTFSGGWQMRVELARLLLKAPKLLLLDEPTNHLDILAIDWLQTFLRDYPGAVLLISHDRGFLDAVTSRTVEISAGRLFDYKFSYSGYLDFRAAEIEIQKKKKKEQEKYIRETRVLIEKFRYKKNKAAFAQSLIRKLERLEDIRVEDFDHSAIRFHFQKPERSGKVVVKGHEMAKSYDGKPVFNHVALEVSRGEKVALLGKNGTGKTTLIRIIAGELSPDNGHCETGHNVITGYYAQDQSKILDEKLTVLETIEKEATGDMFTQSRKILGSFLFSGEETGKKVKVLSGGEKARLALCKLLLKPYNLLVLDEPTNHLDIASKRILKAALQNFEGTLIIVSHDREFLSGLAGRVLEVRKNGVKEYLGGVDDFLAEKRKESIADFERIKRVNAQKNVDKPGKGGENYRQRKLREKELRRLRGKIGRCEKLLEQMEEEQEKIAAELSDPGIYRSPDYQQKLEKHGDILEKIRKLEDEWEEHLLKLEKLESGNAPD